MKKLLQKWLSIKEPKEPDLTQFKAEISKEVDKMIVRFDYFMQKYHPQICDSCNKGFLAHYGGFYKTKYDNGSMTKVACSGKCLDNLKLKK